MRFPIYEACLDRMQVFLDEGGVISQSRPSRRYRDFRELLDRIDEHPNRKYFILKSIIINNLYGVDIMEEAIEICKLRLFLKMVAQIEDVRQIEPLPDIDFNVQAGNTLVGYATYEEVKGALSSEFDFDGKMARFQEKAEDIDHLSEQIRLQQTELGGVTPADKQALGNKLQGLYWKVFTDFPPVFKVNGNLKNSTTASWFSVETSEILKPVIAVLSSNLFWWWYTITTNCRHLVSKDIQNFPVPKSVLYDSHLAELGEVYLEDLQRNSIMQVRVQKQTGRTETQQFKIQKSKHIIDEIDRMLAKYYGFTDEELDFIINYDIKYRMGLGN